MTIPIEEYIQGSKFHDLADYHCQGLTEYNQCILPDLSNSFIIYCHTELVNQLFKGIDREKPFVIISHNGDGKVTNNPQQYDADIKLIPPNLIRWFAQNLTESHEKIESIPVGLENSHILSEVKKIEKIYNQSLKEKQYKNLCYLNFNPYTNPNERIPICNKLKDEKWITTEWYQNGQNYENYVNQLHSHYFVLCPEGNNVGHLNNGGGTGSHRVWECLYLNSIPIVRMGKQSLLFSDLPILFVDSWEQVTKEFLMDQYYRMLKQEYSINKLKVSYWKYQIALSKIL